jgi:pentatricopeptide repeat protein
LVAGLARDMRGLSSLTSRASPAIRNLPEEACTKKKLQRDTPSKAKSKKVTNQARSNNSGALSRGNRSPLNSQSRNPKSVYISKSSIPVDKRTLSARTIDHQYVSQSLSRKDWFLLLSHEVKARRIILNPQSVVSVLQTQENPLHSLKFYIWVSNIDPLFANNQSVRGVLANALYRKGPVVLSVELLQDIRSSGCRVTEDLLCVLIGSWGRLGLAKYCAEVFGQISFLGLSPTTRLCNAVIDALVKANSLDLAYLKFQQMAADNCIPDRFTYNILIHGVCKIGVVDEALRLVKQMEVLGYSPNVFTYTILIDGFCNAKRVDEAFGLLETMMERNVRPSEATIRSLVHGVFRCVAPSKAFQLLSRFVEKKPVFCKLAYNTILYCLSNNSMAGEAARFLKDCGAKGHLPDSSMFNITMACLIKGLDLTETCEIFRSFIDRGVKPGFSTYLALIESTYKVGRSEDGNQFLDQMVKDGLVSNVFSYNMVIDCFCKANKMDRASETFKNMQHRGIDPTLVTYNTLISGYCKEGEIGKARELLVMLLEHGFKPDLFTFSSVIYGLCRVHQLGDAFDCFTEMVEWGIPPNAVTYNILIRSLCVTGDVARSMKLLRNMQANGIRPDTFSFNALIQSSCRLNEVEKAENLFASMMRLGLNPDNYTYSALIKALCKCGRSLEAKEMFHSMEANGCVPDSYTCNLIL